eukprot:CAMPEP_0194213062 /NCGR_PEP_ID=MMETSP0156-20130528/13366_1 /TAXON_ID=33649 /ORGANISM="Thalassionema nitzschioides, Strain L26-B" /LENGTH=703 /DNA_ID=CAMNT_0038941007 /DNA_START=105 /DNA_END=2216 /DNA_ORIENTATION=-
MAEASSSAADMEPMEVKLSEAGTGGDTKATSPKKSLLSCCSKNGVAAYQEMYISPKVFKKSMWALRFAVFVDAIAGTIEQPNYPIMVLKGAHPDSFPTTGGLDFAAATYFVPMSALLGVAIASLVIGTMSDRVGRKPCILLCLYGTVVGCILKFIFKFSFWPYCAFNFINGLMSASVPVSLAYAGDVYETKLEKDNEIGLLVGISMLGSAGGGIIAILMETQGLFVPLLVGSGIVFIAAVTATKYLVEPKDIIASRNREKEQQREEAELGETFEEEEDDGIPVPETLNYKIFSIILCGALGDNVGSSGLFPLCLSPLAYDAFLRERPSDPIMSEVAYKWISVLVALMVVPGTMVSPWIYNKLGLAGGCIGGNVITGIVTIALLYIAQIRPATGGSFGVFVALLYVCFPFTVISQLSTGPMLEAVTPPPKRGFAQGVNITIMNFGAAVSPFLLGTVSDNFGTPLAIWICIIISFLAGVVNIPLIWVKGCNVPTKPVPPERKALKGEDAELVEKALKGEWIPAQDLEELNEARFERGQPYLIVPPRSYGEEKDKLALLRRRARKDFLYHKKKSREYLAKFAIADEEELEAICRQVNQSSTANDPEEVKNIHEAMGKWFIDYVVDSGYSPQTDNVLMKQAIMTTFPPVGSVPGSYTPENLEQVLLDVEKNYARLMELEGFDEEKKGRATFQRVLANARSVIYQQNI